MTITEEKMRLISSDLGLNVGYVKGIDIPVRNCWHFYTDGDSIDYLFHDKEDFIYGMNLIYVMGSCYDVIVIAFILMDTHVHFVLYGQLPDCDKFIHEYVRRMAMWLSRKYAISKVLSNITISHQEITTSQYLKTVICYVLKNAPNGGLHYNAWDYPWSSGALYFRNEGNWNSVDYEQKAQERVLGFNDQRRILRTVLQSNIKIKLIDEMVFPEEYVAYNIVEQIFRTHKGYNYFLGKSKDFDVEEKGGIISQLSIPIQEMRQYKRECSNALFGVDTIKQLNMVQRLLLAKTLKTKYNCSPKQIAKLCGLIYDEVKDKL